MKGGWGSGKSGLFTSYARNTQPNLGANVSKIVNSNSSQATRLLCAKCVQTPCRGLKLYETSNRPGEGRRIPPLHPMGGARRAFFVFVFLFLNERSRSQVAGVRSVPGPHFGKQCHGRKRLLSSSGK